MVLKLTRNRILFQNISRNPQKFASKIEYELNKYLKIRLDRKTIQDVVQMDKVLVPSVEKTLETFKPAEISSDDDVPQEAVIAKGKREDHDSLLFPTEGNFRNIENHERCSSLRQVRIPEAIGRAGY